MCFFLGMIGYIYVASLPGLVARKNQERIIECLSNGKKRDEIQKTVYEKEECNRLLHECDEKCQARLEFLTEQMKIEVGSGTILYVPIDVFKAAEESVSFIYVY